MSAAASRVPALMNPRRVPLAPVDPATPCGGRMKGFALLHLVEHAERTWGAEAMVAWRERLPPALRASTQPQALTSIGWLPLELYFSAVEHLVTSQLGGDARAAAALGHTLSARSIGAFFRATMRFATPPTVLGVAGRFWRSYFDVGSLVLTRTEAGRAVAELREWPLLSEVTLYELAGSFVAWLEASRATAPHLTSLEVQPGGTVAFTVEWG